MRAVLDTNVFVSYLLGSTGRQTTVGAIVRAALSGVYGLLLPHGLLDELIESVATKRKLSRVIDLEDAQDFAAAVRSVGEVLPPPALPSTQISRDADDDYVYLSARQFGTDHRVTGDADLLVLAPVSAPLRIVTPAEFLRVLNETI